VGVLCLADCTSSGIQYTGQSTSGCVQRAKRALFDADFAENLAVAADIATVSGRHGSYYATLHCDRQSRDVRFDVNGPDSAQTDWYRDLLIRKF